MTSLPSLRCSLGRLSGLATLGLLVVASAATSARAEEWTKSYTVSGKARVHADSNDGAVRVTTGESNQADYHLESERRPRGSQRSGSQRDELGL